MRQALATRCVPCCPQPPAGCTEVGVCGGVPQFEHFAGERFTTATEYDATEEQFGQLRGRVRRLEAKVNAIEQALPTVTPSIGVSP